MEMSGEYATYLLICLAAHGEYTILLTDLVLLSSAWLVLEITLEAVDYITAAMSSSVRQVRRFQVVYLNLK